MLKGEEWKWEEARGEEQGTAMMTAEKGKEGWEDKKQQQQKV